MRINKTYLEGKKILPDRNAERRRDGEAREEVKEVGKEEGVRAEGGRSAPAVP